MNKELSNLLSEVFQMRADEIKVDLEKSDIPLWDSLKQMDLVISLEKHYGISLEIVDIVKMKSVADIIDVLNAKGISFEN